MRPALKTLLCLALLCGVCAASAASPALAAGGATPPGVPCWKQVMNEWDAGYIKDIFKQSCYQTALAYINSHAEIRIYSSAADDVQRAKQAAQQGKPPPPEEGGAGISTTPTTTASGSSGSGSSLPLPLIILGGLAVALVVAGGIGMLWQRRNQRDEPPAA